MEQARIGLGATRGAGCHSGALGEHAILAPHRDCPRRRVETFVPCLFLYASGVLPGVLAREFDLTAETLRRWVREWRQWLLEDVERAPDVTGRLIGGPGVHVQAVSGGGRPGSAAVCADPWPASNPSEALC